MISESSIACRCLWGLKIWVYYIFIEDDEILDLTLNKALKKENFGRASKKCETLFMVIHAGL